mgnify:CR=1 FL=1
MRIDFGATVRTSDGHDAGTIKGAVVDPRSREIDQFIVSTGRLLGRDVLVSRAELENATGDAETLRLRLTRKQLEDMPDYVPANYIPPPAGWSAPVDYEALPSDVFMWPATYAAPTETAAPSLLIEDQTEPALMKGARAVDRDLEDVGVVDEVRFDAGSGRIEAVVIRLGGAVRTMLGGGETVDVDASLIDEVAEGAVRLRVRKAELRPSSRG